MNAKLLIATAGLALMTAGCHNYSTNVGEVLGCTLAGNGCDDGRTGAPGADGSTGSPGSPGSPGASCSVQTVAADPVVAPAGGARITCTDGSDALLLNGTNGSNAPSTPYTIVQVVKPCPTVSGANPEVLLVLSNRSILASISSNSNGNNTRLGLVTPGSYVTSDGRSCRFSVTATAITYAGGSVSY